VDEKRAAEVKELRFRYLVHAFMLTALRTLPLCIIGLSFFFYTAVEGNSLVPSIAFPALSLFNLLRVPLSRLAELTSQIQQCKTSMKRMDAFLRDSETEKYEQLGNPTSPKPDTPFIGFKCASFRWTSSDLDNSNSAPVFQLLDLDISFQTGMNLVVGSTGSGKTSLLLALLGEMHLLQGSVHLPGGYSRALLEPNPETGLTESVAYCAQESWLLNGTIKQNILFGSVWDEHRYQEVISHCALLADLELLPDGDQTLVGEKGVMLSGGQKQRISLARAVYSSARYVLLDDCLSAVDSYTAEYLFQSLCGPTMSNRVVILVTNNESLCIPKSDYVVMISEGRISAQGTPCDLSEKGIIEYTIPSPHSTSSFPDELKSGKIVNDNSSTLVGDLSRSEQGEAKDSTIQIVSESDIHTRIENSAEGAVSWRVARLYLSAMGRWHLVTLMLVGLTLENIAQMLVNNWIRTWSDAYTDTLIAGRDPGFTSKMSDVQNFVLRSYSAVPLLFTNTSISAVADGRDVDDVWYASVYAGFVALTTIVGFVSISSMFLGSLNASQGLHSRLIQSVLGAKFKFIDNTPMGQLMNRFSKDVQTIDQLVIHGIVGLVIRSGSILCIIFLITLIIPTFLLPAVLLSIVYGIVGLLYLRTSRDLKRLEAVQRSPIHQQFGETLRGVVTIRAFGEEARFIRDNETNIDAHSSPFLCLWACTRWLSFRFDMAGSLVAFSAAALILSNLNNVDAGAAGLSLTYALGFNTAVQLWVFKQNSCFDFC
jgi:ABC-type multidrug transport system fused ATPase/permease subunit